MGYTNYEYQKKLLAGVNNIAKQLAELNATLKTASWSQNDVERLVGEAVEKALGEDKYVQCPTCGELIAKEAFIYYYADGTNIPYSAICPKCGGGL